MSDIDKGRAQRDAQRTSSRRTGGRSRAEEAIGRYLGVGLYQARERDDEKSAPRPDETTGRPRK